MSSQRRGRCRTISRGSVSAARITRSATPRFRAFGCLVRAILHLRLEDGLVAQAYKLLGELVVSHKPRAGLAGVLLGRLGIDLLVRRDDLLHLLLALIS